MNVSKILMALLLGVLAAGAIAPGGLARAESEAIEITAVPAEDEAEEASDSAAADDEVQAIEITALENTSLREVGDAPVESAPKEPAATANELAESGYLEPYYLDTGFHSDRQEDWWPRVDANFRSDQQEVWWPTDSYPNPYGRGYQWPGSGGEQAGMGGGQSADWSSWAQDAAHSTGYRSAASRDQAGCWLISGSLGFGTGSATYADNETQEFSLKESLKTLKGDHFEFYQEYAVDHSYVNSGTLTVGARQRFRDWAAGGDLRLTEEFKLYRDRDNSTHDRQEGMFALRFDPAWDDGRWDATLDYKYRVRVYETFSTRSYLNNAVRAALEYNVTPALAATTQLRFDDYNYSTGSTRSNNRTALSHEWEWQATKRLRLSAGVESEHKEYNVDKDRTYNEQGLTAGLRWDIARGSRVEIKGALADYDRPNELDESYEDTRAEVRWRQDVTGWLDFDVRFNNRENRYDISPQDDLDQSQLKLRLNFNPNRRWNFHTDFGQSQYDYANPNRAFDRRDLGFGMLYRFGQLRATADYSQREVSYDNNPLRDYTRDDFDLNLDYRIDRHRWRVYYGIGVLDQSNPASVNGYDEVRLGAQWDYKLDCRTSLELSYDFSEREYDALSSIDNSLLEAKLNFEL